MKHIIICLGIIVGLFAHGHAMQTPEQSKKSAEILAKMRQIDLLTQLIPLALTKDQINTLLPVIERARAKLTQLNKDEATALEKLDSKITEAIKKSVETSVAPPKALLDELAEATMKMSLNRDAAGDEFTDLILKTFTDTCNAGQRKAAANSLAPQLFDPSLKPDKMTEQEKLRFFVRNILLDPQAYDVLVQLAKHAS